jgi:hypothetical protein
MNGSIRHCIALLLGLVIAIAPAAFAVPATAMTLQMSMSSDDGCADCDCCPKAKADHSVCPLICTNALSYADVPEQLHIVFIAFSVEHRLKVSLALPDHISSPDPPPPKPV